jgi:hypothetical protein
MTATRTPAAPKLSPTMAGNMVYALAGEHRTLYCTASTGRALATPARGYAAPTADGYALTPAGVLRAVDLYATADAATRTTARRAARESAARVCAVDGNESVQPARIIAMTDPDGTPVEMNNTPRVSGDAARRMISGWLLDGARITRTRGGRVITVVRLTGRTVTLTAADDTTAPGNV